MLSFRQMGGMDNMRKKLGIAGIGAVALALIMTLATVPTQGDFWTEHSGHCHIGDDCGVALIAGKNTNAGKVEVTFDKDGLHVEYVASSPWTITETHLLVLTEKPPVADSDYFNKNGNPQLGHFPYAGELSYDIPWGDIPGFTWCTPIYIIAHCVISKTVGGVTTTETGYGDGTKFSKQWAMYFTCTPCNHKLITLPEGAISINGAAHWDNSQNKVISPYTSYWIMKLSNVPANDYVVNGEYNAYCLEDNDYMVAGKDYTHVHLISSYADGLDAQYNGFEWPKINWVMNYYKDAAYGGPYDPTEVQYVLWYLTGHESMASLDARGDDAHILAEEADAHGGDFYPTLGQDIVILLFNEAFYGATHCQLTIIVVDP